MVDESVLTFIVFGSLIDAVCVRQRQRPSTRIDGRPESSIRCWRTGLAAVCRAGVLRAAWLRTGHGIVRQQWHW